jgi:hypothetical protein
MVDGYLNDFEAFNHLWGEDLPLPPPELANQGPPPIPDPPAVGAAAHAQLGHRPPIEFRELVMRYPRNQQPPADQTVGAQGRKRGNIEGDYHDFMGYGLPGAELDPLPQFRVAAENNRQRDNQLMVDAMHGRMVDRVRRRSLAGNEDVRRDDDLSRPAVFGRQAQAAAVQAAAMRAAAAQDRRAEAEAEGGWPRVAIPPVPQPPARNDHAAAGFEAGEDPAVGPGQDNDAARRRQLKERLDRMVGNLEDPDEERRRLLSERLRRLRAAAQDHEEEGERRRFSRENIDRVQIQGQGQEEDLRVINGRLDRLRAQKKNTNAAEPAGGRNDNGEARRELLDRFNDVFANFQAGEPVEGRNDDRDVGQLRDRRWMRFGRHQEDPPAAVLRQQHILDHEERRLQRTQQMARLRREQLNDEAATAKRLELIRRSIALGGVENQAPIALADSPEPEELSDSDEADEADDEEEYEDEIWI